MEAKKERGQDFHDLGVGAGSRGRRGYLDKLNYYIYGVVN